MRSSGSFVELGEYMGEMGGGGACEAHLPHAVRLFTVLRRPVLDSAVYEPARETLQADDILKRLLLRDCSLRLWEMTIGADTVGGRARA